jgi:DNA repair exonuclease SbcCD nuclease subunit
MIVGDPHFGKGANIAKPNPGDIHSRDKDKFNIFNWIFKKANEESTKTKHIAITGDVFDEFSPGLLLIKLLFSFLNEKRNEFIIHIIPGNHDLKRTGANYLSVLDILNEFKLENIHIYNEITSVLIDNCYVTFVPFRDVRWLNAKSNEQAVKIIKDKLHKEISSAPSSASERILIGHLALEGSLYVGDEIDDLQNEIFCPVDMFEGYSHVFMGHIHKPQVLSKSPYQAHVGSLDISDFGEMNHEKIIVYFDENRKQEKFVNIPVPVRPLRHISIVVPPGVPSDDYIKSEIIKNDKTAALMDSTLKLTIKFEDKKSDQVNRKVIEELIYSLGTHYLCEFSEHRVSSVTSTKIASILSADGKTEDFELTSLTPEEVFKIWIASQKIETQEKSSILTLALSLIKDVKAAS